MAQYCGQCGSPVLPNASFCNICGAQIENDANPNASANANPYAANPYANWNGGAYYDDPNAPDIPGFGGAFKVCMTQKYCSTEGRASRSEFWFFYLWRMLIGLALGLIVGFVVGGVMAAQGSDPYDVVVAAETIGNVLDVLLGLVFLCPTIAVGVRRLHDTNRSGWNWLWLFFPIVGWILLLVYFASAPTQGPNQYGAQPFKRY